MNRIDDWRFVSQKHRVIHSIVLGVVIGLHTAIAPAEHPGNRPRLRELGIRIGVLACGPHNAITDVSGVRVGHQSIVRGADIRTGVTAILAHPENLFQSKVPAAVHVANGFGKLVGSTQVKELGLIETPILLTNTLSTFAVADAVVDWSLKQPGNENVLSVNPVVGECNDGYLNDIRGQHVTAKDAIQAIAAAEGGPVAEGCVGAGVGTRCLGWKGGIGTSSRRLPERLGGHTVGVLVQTNFGGELTIAGVPVGRALGRYLLKDAVVAQEHGSCIVVVATDAPLDARQLQRLAKRATLGLGSAGSPLTHGSGDYVVAFSTDRGLRHAYQSDSDIQKAQTQKAQTLRDEALSPLFQAVRDATEEAVINSLLKATTTKGFRGRTVDAIDPGEVLRICRAHNAVTAEPSWRSEASTSRPRSGVVATIERSVPDLQKELRVPGVSVTLIRNRAIAWSKGFGNRCQGDPSPVTPNTVMEACSMSKPFFAYSVLRAVENGHWDLKRPLVEYLDGDYLDLAPSHRRITSEMVLSHTSGLPNWRKGGWRSGRSMELAFEPGEKFRYSGEGFLMLQRAIEKQTGEPLDSWSQESLIKPLGLERTGFRWTPSFQSNAACGHDRDGEINRERQHYDRANAAFTLYTSSDDYARFLIEIMKPDRSGAHSISTSMTETMLTPMSYRPEQKAHWGLGWGLKSRGQAKLAYHSGSNGSGFRCYSEFQPATGDGLVIMTNAVGGKELWNRLLEILYPSDADEKSATSR